MRRAHFYADADRVVYVRLPDDDPKAKQLGVCVKLRKTMCGSLDAAQLWEEHYAQVWETEGFSRGVASPCHFFHKGLQTHILVHGDDFFIVGRRDGRKLATLGPDSSQSRTASFLGRTLTLRQWRIEYDQNQQHVSRTLKALGLTNARLKLFQSVAARFNFPAMDRPDLLYSVKKLMRQMASPRSQVSLPSREFRVTQSNTRK